MVSASDGRVITFYSYKGGTGRSMALAHAAWITAARGYRVLAIDWDLEAPGLHKYFAPFLEDGTASTTARRQPSLSPATTSCSSTAGRA